RARRAVAGAPARRVGRGRGDRRGRRAAAGLPGGARVSEDVRIAVCPREQIADFLRPISIALAGRNVDAEGAERFAGWVDEGRLHAAYAGDELVGAAAAFTYDLTVPGGWFVPTGGVTVVAVLPSHRRRGLLGKLMRAQLDDLRARGEPLAALWASETMIYA